MRKNRQTASMYSLTEFAYLLLFIFIGAAVILFIQIGRDKEKIAELTKEADFLQKMLDEKKDGAVPCWKRPDSPVPEVAGTIVIHNSFSYTVQNHRSGDRPFLRSSSEDMDNEFKAIVLKMFKADMGYAKAKKCYVRVKIINETNDYSLYKEAASILKTLGIVVVNG